MHKKEGKIVFLRKTQNIPASTLFMPLPQGEFIRPSSQNSKKNQTQQENDIYRSKIVFQKYLRFDEPYLRPILISLQPPDSISFPGYYIDSTPFAVKSKPQILISNTLRRHNPPKKTNDLVDQGKEIGGYTLYDGRVSNSATKSPIRTLIL